MSDFMYVDTYPWVDELYEEIRERLETYRQPLDRYVEKFAPFRQFIQIDVDKYVADFFASDPPPSAQQVRRKIEHHLGEKRKIDIEIPNQMWLGFFLVRCQVSYLLEIRNAEWQGRTS